MSWNLEKLHNEVEILYGKDRKTLVIESSNSIVERLNYSCFYFEEAKNLFDCFFENRRTLRDSIDLIFYQKNPSELEEFEIAFFKIKAHILSFLQNLHSISDILSHVIFHSIGLSSLSKPIKIRDVSINSVLKEIEKNKKNCTLTNLVKDLIHNEEYNYLSAIVNKSKHCSIVEPFFNINFRASEGKHHEIKFIEFNSNNSTHPQKLAFNFMQSEYDRQNNLIVHIGNEINTITENLLLYKNTSA